MKLGNQEENQNKQETTCEICGGLGAVDSGGVTPWGEFIELPYECLIKDHTLRKI